MVEMVGQCRLESIVVDRVGHGDSSEQGRRRDHMVGRQKAGAATHQMACSEPKEPAAAVCLHRRIVKAGTGFSLG